MGRRSGPAPRGRRLRRLTRRRPPRRMHRADRSMARGWLPAPGHRDTGVTTSRTGWRVARFVCLLVPRRVPAVQHSQRRRHHTHPALPGGGQTSSSSCSTTKPLLIPLHGRGHPTSGSATGMTRSAVRRCCAGTGPAAGSAGTSFRTVSADPPAEGVRRSQPDPHQRVVLCIPPVDDLHVPVEHAAVGLVPGDLGDGLRVLARPPGLGGHAGAH